MDRRSKIFAPTTNIGGVRRPYKPKSGPTGPSIKATLSDMKGEIHPTILKTCAFKSGDKIVNFQNPQIQSITTKGKGAKHICFLVTGETTSVDEKEAMRDMPSDIQALREKMEGKENQDATNDEAVENIHKEEKTESPAE